MRNQKPLSTRILSLALTAAMVLTTMPITTFAAGGDAVLGASGISTTTRTITAFDELGEGFSKPAPFDGHTYLRNVELNTPFAEVKLPTELSVTVEKTTTNTAPPAKAEGANSGEAPKAPAAAPASTAPAAAPEATAAPTAAPAAAPEATAAPTAAPTTAPETTAAPTAAPAAAAEAPADAPPTAEPAPAPVEKPAAEAPPVEKPAEPKQENTAVTETIQEKIPVTWTGDKEYTPAENSTVIYTAVLPKGYALADSAKLPSIHVMVGRQAPAPRSARAAEQFALPVGQTYYFDLSAAGLSGTSGTINTAVPDTSLHYVPFTYAGTVNAYSLTKADAGKPAASDTASASDRSLFVADYNIIHYIKWGELDYENLIFGKPFDKNYTLRSLSVGNSGSYKGVFPESNEWDRILKKAEIKNWDGIFSYGQDYTAAYTKKCPALRGGRIRVDHFDADDESYSRAVLGFRPALQVGSVSSLKAVTLNLNGGSLNRVGSSFKIVCAGDTFTAPSETGLNRPTGSYFEWNTAQNGSGDSYIPGASVSSSVDTLYAQWVKPAPAIAVAKQSAAATYGTVASPTYAVAASNFGGKYPLFAPQIAWTKGSAPTGVTTAFSGANNETLTMTTTGATPAGDYQFKVVSPKTSPETGNYESAEATLKVDKLTAAITWGANSFPYNGNEQAPTATVDNAVNGDVLAVTVTGGKTNAGSHTATASALTGAAATSYALPTPAPTQGFTIAAKSVATTLVSGSVTKVYDGTTAAGTGAIAVTTGDILAGDTGVTVSAGANPAYNAATVGTSYSLDVPVVLNGDINHNYTLANSTVAVTGSITAKPVTGLNDGNLKITKEYDGTTGAGTAAGALSSADFVASDSGKVFASVTSVGDYPDAAVGQNKTVSLHVALTGPAAGNYSLASDTYSFLAAEITKATPKVTVTAAKKVKRSFFGIPIGDKEDTFVITAEVTGVTGENPAGTVQLKANGTALGSALTLNNGAASFEWIQPDAGTYTITAEFTANTNPNYTNATGTSKQYEVSKAEQAAITFTSPTQTTVTYGEPAIAFAVTGGTGLGAVTYASSAPAVVAEDGKIMGKGTATITATKAADKNYNATTATISITVNPAQPIAAWGTTTQSLAYTGSKAAITAPVVTLVNGESYDSKKLQYAYKKSGLFGLFADYTDGLPTSAGEYTVKAKIAAEGNYTAADSTNALTLTITKSAPTVSIQNTYTGKTYDGAAMPAPAVGQMTITGAGYADVNFAYSKDSSMSNPSATAPADVGTYWVKASIAEGTNTAAAASAAVPFTITKKAVTATVTGNDKVYDATTSADGMKLSVDTGIAADKITITITGGAAYAGKDVGAGQTITIGGTTITGDKKDNYTITIPALTGEISQKTVSVTAAVTAKSYDGSTAASATYTVNDVIGAETVTATGTAAFDNANAGVNKTVNITGIQLTGADSANYSSSAGTTTQGTIHKAAVTVAIAAIPAFDFTGSQIKPTLTVTTTGGTALKSTDYTVEYGANVDAGTGSVTVKAAAGGNYTFTDAPASFLIKKIDYTGTAIVGTKLVKENTAQTGAEFDLSTLPIPAGFKDKTFGAARYSINTQGVLTGTPSITGTTLTFGVGAVAKGMSGVIDIVVSSKNYNDYTAKVTVTTVEKTPVTIRGTAATGLVYSGSAQQGYTAVSVEGDKVPVSGLYFTYSGTEKNGTAYGPTPAAPTKAGDYKLVISVKSNNPTYVGISHDILFGIEQKPLNIQAIDKFTYQHKDMPATELVYQGFVNAENAAVLGVNAYTAAHTAANTATAGAFAINVLGSTTNKNYSITTANGKLTIYAVSTPEPARPAPPTTAVTEPEVVAEPADPAKKLRVFSGALAPEDRAQTLKHLTVPAGGVAIAQEVELQVSSDNGVTWTKATAADVKNGRMQVVLPIPAGTSPSTHTYAIYHFANGATAAPYSLDPTVSVPTNSLSATVNSLSPFVAVATPKGGGNPGGNGGSSSGTYYYIKATAGPGGFMSTGERVKVGAGESAGFTITPNKGYQIQDVLVNGKSIGAKNYYAFTKVYSDQTIHATFKKAKHKNPQTGVSFDDVKTGACEGTIP